MDGLGTSDGERPRFEELARLEPRLMRLLARCRIALRFLRVRAGEHDDGAEEGSPDDLGCVEDFFYRVIKPEMRRLVGRDRLDDPDALRSRAAYEVVHRVLESALPPCPCEVCRGDDD